MSLDLEVLINNKTTYTVQGYLVQIIFQDVTKSHPKNFWF